MPTVFASFQGSDPFRDISYTVSIPSTLYTTTWESSGDLNNEEKTSRFQFEQLPQETEPDKTKSKLPGNIENCIFKH